MTVTPPRAMMERSTPVLPRRRLGMGSCLAAEAFRKYAALTSAAAVVVLRKSRRCMKPPWEKKNVTRAGSGGKEELGAYLLLCLLRLCGFHQCAASTFGD